MAGSSAPWIGSAYLFLKSTCKTITLPSLYESSQKTFVFKALKMALAAQQRFTKMVGGWSTCYVRRG
uniref:Uncharacterized protein n=1 Tax=Malurus cyaneus samueli TaxID=2593467 RepID=A0A8C5T3E2_9PASS